MPAADPQAAFDEAGTNLNVDPMMLRAIAQVESGGEKDPDRAVSSAGARGRMQVMPPNLKRYNVTDPADPRQNIHAGAALLDEALTAANGNVPLALRIYQGGQDQSKWGPQNAAYPAKVAAAYQALAKAAPKTGKAAAAPDATDDFLSGGGAPDAAKTAPTAPDATDEFLAGKEDAKPADLGTKQFPPETAETRRIGDLMTPGPPTAPVTGPQPGVNIPGVSGPPPGLRLGEVGRAAKEGYDSGAVFTPEAIQSFDHAHWGLLPRGVNMLAGVAGGLYGGARDLVGQTIDSALPGAGRDATQAMDLSAPFAGLRAPEGVAPRMQASEPAPRAPGGAAPVGQAGRDSPLAPGATNQLAEAARNPPVGDTIPTMTVRPGMGGPEPAPNAAGAQASTAAEATMTREEIAANRHNADKEWLNQTNQPGVADSRELIPGVNPTLAQREQTVQTAREQKSISQQDTVVSDEERALADAHNQTRSDFYKQPDLSGSSVQLANGEKVAGDKMEAGLAKAFANKTEANAQPVVDLADTTLRGRSGKRAAISSEVTSVRSRLFDADGNLETDPEVLYGVREHINDVLSKENQAQNPVSKRAQSVLIAMRDKLDEVIEPAAPGFKAAIAGYAEDMKPLDVMRALAERESGLFDNLGRMQFSRVHSLMRDIIDARQPGAALSPFQHITDAQMAKLKSLHDDLKRVASSEDLARAKGSDTAQNLWDAGKTAAKGVIVRAANMAPVLGPALRRGSEAYAPIAEARAANKLRQRGLSMLHPDPAKYPLRDPNAPP